MQANMEDISLNTQQLIVSKLSLEEQVFSNHLLMDLIWNHFATQDLIRTSLVNRAWFTKSRELLTADTSKHAVCIQMDSHSPCRTLLKLNAFLKDRTEGTNIHTGPIILNGITLMYHWSYSHSENYKCRDCLKYDWIPNDIEEEEEEEETRILDENREQLVMDQLPEMFGNILSQINFKHFRLHNRLSFYCPFACLIKWCFRNRPESILEISSGMNSILYDDLDRKFLFENISPTTRFPEFLNLEVLGISHMSLTAHGRNLPVVAPSLKEITLFPYMNNPDYNLAPNFPHHVITKMTITVKTTGTAVQVLEEFHPKIKVLDISGNCKLKIERKEDLYQLGRLVSSTLTNLTCEPSSLNSMVFSSRGSTVHGTGIRNRFPALNILNLTCSIDENALDWFHAIDFVQDFPELQTVRFKFVGKKSIFDSPAIESNKSGFLGNGQFGRIKNLRFETVSMNDLSMGREFYWVNSFSNINHLDLTGMPFEYDRQDEKFSNFLGELNNLQFLKKLSMKSQNLSCFCLDHLFMLNIPEIEKRLEDLNLEHLLVYKSSLLDHKSLDQIVIHGSKNCIKRVSSEGVSRCFSSQKSGTFLVSSKIAEIICKHRPGFKFSLKISGACIPECTSGFQPGGLRLDHLEPCAKITTEQAPGVKFQRFWGIEFLDLIENGKDSLYTP